jgi:hypothetical protein
MHMLERDETMRQTNEEVVTVLLDDWIDRIDRAGPVNKHGHFGHFSFSCSVEFTLIRCNLSELIRLKLRSPC